MKNALLYAFALPTLSDCVDRFVQESIWCATTVTSVIANDRSYLGALMHLAAYSRPDTAVCSIMFGPLRDCAHLTNIATCGRLQQVHKEPIFQRVIAFCVANFAVCTETHRSVKGSPATLSSVVSVPLRGRLSVKTLSVSLPLSEYIAAGVVLKDVQYVSQCAREQGLGPQCIPIGCNNSMAF
jgi:hypothetical protein